MKMTINYPWFLATQEVHATKVKITATFIHKIFLTIIQISSNEKELIKYFSKAILGNVILLKFYVSVNMCLMTCFTGKYL